MKKIFARVVKHGSGCRSEVAITFDDGPNQELTPKIMELFEQFGMRATFFVTGKAVELHPEIIRSLLEKGHQIGNHSWNHKSMIFKPGWFLNNEICRTDSLLESLGVPQPIHFRPPYMRMLIITSRILASKGKLCIKATVSPKDFNAESSEEIVEKVLAKVKAGSIIVMHDGGKADQKTLDALKVILPELAKRDLPSVTVDELLI